MQPKLKCIMYSLHVPSGLENWTMIPFIGVVWSIPHRNIYLYLYIHIYINGYTLQVRVPPKPIPRTFLGGLPIISRAAQWNERYLRLWARVRLQNGSSKRFCRHRYLFYSIWIYAIILLWRCTSTPGRKKSEWTNRRMNEWTIERMNESFKARLCQAQQTRRIHIHWTDIRYFMYCEYETFNMCRCFLFSMQNIARSKIEVLYFQFAQSIQSQIARV